MAASNRRESTVPRTPISLLLVTLFLFALAGCRPNGAQPAGGMPPAQVGVVTVAPRDLPVEFEYTGRAAGFREVEVRARVTGILLKRHYQEGAAVKAGQLLFEIDPAPFRAALDKTEAELVRTEAEQARAAADAARLRPLREANAVSQKEYDDAVAAERIAQAQVLAARAQVAEARLNLGYTRVTAPIDGLSGRAQPAEGSLVSAQEATLLTTITQLEPMYALFGIADGDRLRLESEAAAGRLVLPRDGRFGARLRLADGRMHAREGRVDFSDSRVDAATGTLEGRALFANPDGSLRPGQFVRVILAGAHRPGAILLPQRAVMEGPAGKFVYVVDGEGKAQPRPVEAGDWIGDEWLILGGLAAGDRVIVDGVLKVMPGAPVTIEPPAAAAGH
jgi:membrane fusion protein (multidrug efflux system)